jgi:hypothetical protein
MRRFAFFWCAAILAGCAKSKDRPAEEATARTAVEAAAVRADDGGPEQHAAPVQGDNTILRSNVTPGTPCHRA